MPTSEVRKKFTPAQVLQLLQAGNYRFAAGQTIDRDPHLEVRKNAAEQNPLAVVLACMDSRVATEIVFDLSLGDIFSVRVAGNIVSEQALGSLEFGCAVAGAKLLLVLGHTRCGAVGATADLVSGRVPAESFARLENLASITDPIAVSVGLETETAADRHGLNTDFVDRVAAINVVQSMQQIRARSGALRKLEGEGEILIAGALYDITTGLVKTLDPS